MRLSLSAVVLSLAALTSSLHAADVVGYTLTAPQATQLKAVTIIYKTIHSSINTQSEPVYKALGELYAKLKAGNIMPTGGPIFIYKTLVTDPAQPLDIEVAFPVADNTPAPEGFESRVVPSTSTMTAIFEGPASALSRAYPDFFRQLEATGKSAKGELRQHMLFSEGAGSPNNIFLIEVQVGE